MVFCLGTEGYKSSLLRNGWFQCFSVKELKVPTVPYLEMGGSIVFLFMNRRFQKFPIYKWVVPMVSCLGTEGSKSSLLIKWVVTMFFC